MRVCVCVPKCVCMLACVDVRARACVWVFYSEERTAKCAIFFIKALLFGQFDTLDRTTQQCKCPHK